jgi:hypothetical protein
MASAPAKPDSRKVNEDKIAQTCRVVRRAAWGAAAPKKTLTPDWNYNSIVVHYPGHGLLRTPRAIQQYDFDHNNWDDVSYHYVISTDGQIFEGRELIYKGSHVLLQNTGKIGIVCIGDFDDMIGKHVGIKILGADPSPALLASLKRLTKTLCHYFPIRTFGGHKEYGNTEVCPGSRLLPIVQHMRSELQLAAPAFKTTESLEQQQKLKK